jgi:hypothetical protein
VGGGNGKKKKIAEKAHSHTSTLFERQEGR